MQRSDCNTDSMEMFWNCFRKMAFVAVKSAIPRQPQFCRLPEFRATQALPWRLLVWNAIKGSTTVSIKSPKSGTVHTMYSSVTLFCSGTIVLHCISVGHARTYMEAHPCMAMDMACTYVLVCPTVLLQRPLSLAVVSTYHILWPPSLLGITSLIVYVFLVI